MAVKITEPELSLVDLPESVQPALLGTIVTVRKPIKTDVSGTSFRTWDFNAIRILAGNRMFHKLPTSDQRPCVHAAMLSCCAVCFATFLGCKSLGRVAKPAPKKLVLETLDLSALPSVQSPPEVLRQVAHIIDDDPEPKQDSKTKMDLETLPDPANDDESEDEADQEIDASDTENDTDSKSDHAPIVTGPVQGITKRDLEGIAAISHPAILAAQAQVAVARGQWHQSGLAYNPVLNYQSEEIGNDDSTGIHSLGVSQRFITANKLGLAQNSQSHVVQQRIAELRLARLTVLTNVRSAFARAWVAQQQAELSDQIVRSIADSMEQVQQLMDVGEVSRLTLLQAQVELSKAQIEADNNRSQLENLRLDLAAQAGLSRLPSADPLDAVAPELDPKPWDSLINQIVDANPVVDANNSQLQRTRWALHLACAQAIPDITGQVALGLDTASDDTFVSLGVSVPLPIRNRNQGNVRSAHASIQAAQAELELTKLNLQSKLAGVVNRYQVARLQYNRLREKVLPNSIETVELGRKAFAAGEANYIQLLTAQRTLFEVRGQILRSLGDALKANAEIQGLLVTTD